MPQNHVGITRTGHDLLLMTKIGNLAGNKGQ